MRRWFFLFPKTERQHSGISSQIYKCPHCWSTRQFTCIQIFSRYKTVPSWTESFWHNPRQQKLSSLYKVFVTLGGVCMCAANLHCIFSILPANHQIVSVFITVTEMCQDCRLSTCSVQTEMSDMGAEHPKVEPQPWLRTCMRRRAGSECFQVHLSFDLVFPLIFCCKGTPDQG